MSPIGEVYAHMMVRWSHLAVLCNGHVAMGVYVSGTTRIMSTDMDSPLGNSVQNAVTRHTVFVSRRVCPGAINLTLPLYGVLYAVVVESSQDGISPSQILRLLSRE